MSPNLFVSIDGNGIGKKIESYILANRFSDLNRFSRRVSAAVQELADRIILLNGRVIMSGGDNLLGSIPDSSVADLLSAVKSINTPDTEFAVGLGPSACDSYLALKFAKASNTLCIQHDAQHGFFPRP